MFIETQRTIIRPFSMDDAADLQEILGDEETMRYSEPAYDLAKTRQFLQSFCIDRQGALAVQHKASGKMIGYLLFNQTEPETWEMGWFFNRAFWRQGYAYESCRAVLDYAFRELRIHTVFAETIDTVKSVQLMKKLGMRPDDAPPEQVQDVDGGRPELYLYTISANEWRALDNLN